MKTMTIEARRELKSKLKSALMNCIGPGRKIGMGELYSLVFDQPWSNRINDTKFLRVLIDELQHEGLRICSSRSRVNGGYWLAATGTELNGYCDVLTHEALKKLKKVAGLRRMALPELVGELSLNLKENTDIH